MRLTNRIPVTLFLTATVAASAQQAVQLPSSGRGMEAAGQVSASQMTMPAGGAGVLQPSIAVIGNYQGGVSGSVVEAGPLKLSMAEAIRRGLEANLGVITSQTASEAVRAQRMQALSQLLPQINGSLGEAVMQTNMASYGFTSLGSGIPAIVGPFQYVQARASFNWNAISLTSFKNVQTANTVNSATRLSAKDARELVVEAVGGSYLQVVSMAVRVDSQRRQVESAKSIYDRAEAQLNAGTNTRIDATRSLVQLQAEQERLLSLEGEYAQQKIALARMIGLPLAAEFTLTEPLEQRDELQADEAAALSAAQEHRLDLRAAALQKIAAEQALTAARAERLPSVSFNGYYEASGTHPEKSHGDFVAQGTINIPIFDGGRISGEIRQARATLEQRQAELNDQKRRVEQDVRNALIQLRTASGQVKLAQSNRQLAEETLTQAKDRFEAGVTNTVEVVQAQQQEAAAESDYISSLFAWNLARLGLARATGEAETEIKRLFPGETR